MALRPSIAIITLDALRFDTALEAKTPNIEKLMQKYQRDPKGWVKVGAQGTYTMTAHLSMFHAGIFPCVNEETALPLYNRRKLSLFKATLSWTRSNNALYPTPEADNIVRGFQILGYRTLGIGGVHWFDSGFQTSGNLWSRYFEEFYWRPQFGEDTPNSFELQIELAQRVLSRHDRRPLFFFLNVSATHSPYRGLEPSIASQAKCLEYVDGHLPSLLSYLPQPLHLILLSDHGDCFGEDGFWGHGFYHPRIMEIPMVSLEIEFDIADLPTWTRSL
jgi:hypothetical protein